MPFCDRKVFQETGYSQSRTHFKPAECDRQAIQARSDHTNRMASPPRGLPSNMFPVASGPSGPVLHQVQQQTTSICLTSARPPGVGSGCTQPLLGGPGTICLPTSSHIGQSGGEVAGLPLQQNHSDCSRVAQHALVLGHGGLVQSDPIMPTQPGQSSDSNVQ